MPQAGIVSKRMNGSSSFSARRIVEVLRTCGYLHKVRYITPKDGGLTYRPCDSTLVFISNVSRTRAYVGHSESRAQFVLGRVAVFGQSNRCVTSHFGSSVHYAVYSFPA